MSESGIGKDYSLSRALSHIFNILSFATMCPFGIVEYWTVIAQRSRWLQFRNLLDMCVILLQAFIFTCHVMTTALSQEWFGAILATQCVILYAKLQSYGR